MRYACGGECGYVGGGGREVVERERERERESVLLFNFNFICLKNRELGVNQYIAEL